MYKYLGIFLIIFSFANSVFAKDLYANIKPIDPLKPAENQIVPIVFSQPKKATLTHNDIYNQYIIAYNRFIQSNVKSAYMDFKILTETMKPSDFAYMQMAEKMADIGFFNISTLASSKIQDKEISDYFVDDIKRFYFPSKKLKAEDEIYLGEVYSNIVYNDQSKEATSELLNNSVLLETSDYANYIAALGFFKQNDIISASNFIDRAISMNAQNINYKKLKAEILAQSKKPQNAIKMVEYIKAQHFYTADFARKINSLEQYVLYKSQKNENQKNYHLGYYYYYENEYAKSIRTLQGAICSKKKINQDVYSLMSKVYFDMKDYEKAQDNALKALKLNSNNPTALLVLGDLKYLNKDYKTALKYYKDAENSDSSSSVYSIRAAMTYEQLNKQKKALEIYQKVLKTYSDAYLAYYKIALNDKSREIPYLKKAIAINMHFKDAWIDLGKLEIERQNFENAKNYLAIANYIDENDFRYYYYQGLIYKNQGLKHDAVYFFKKSLILNPDYQPAKEELTI